MRRLGRAEMSRRCDARLCGVCGVCGVCVIWIWRFSQMKEGFEKTIAKLEASVVKLKKVGVIWRCCDILL